MKREQHVDNKAVEFEKRARKPTFPVRFGSFACSQTRRVGSMCDEDLHPLTCTVPPCTMTAWLWKPSTGTLKRTCTASWSAPTLTSGAALSATVGASCLFRCPGGQTRAHTHTHRG